MEHNKDVILVENTLKGDIAAFSELVRNYSNTVFATAFSIIGDFHDAQDIAQEAFVKAWHNLSNLKEGDKFSGWLLTIARRLSIDFLRKNKSLKYVPLPEDTEIHDNEKNVEETLLHKERQTVLWTALKQLDENHRIVLLLYYFYDLNTRKIAETLNISTNTIESRLRRSRKKLKKELIHMLQETLVEHRLGEEFEDKVMNRIVSVACLNIPVRNIEKSVSFYVHHLGCTLSRDIQTYPEGNKNAFIKFGDGLSALLHQEKSPYSIHFMRNGEPAPILELLTSNIRDLYHLLKKEGIDVIGGIDVSSCGDRFQVIDPDGNRITIIQG